MCGYSKNDAGVRLTASTIGRARQLVVIIVVALSALSARGAVAQTGALFSPVTQEQIASLTPDQARHLRQLRQTPTTADLQVVRVNRGALKRNFVRIQLNAKSVIALKRKTLVRGATEFTWIADLPRQGSDAVLVVRNGNVTGTIQDGSKRYTLTPLGRGLHALIALDQSKFPKEHPPGALPRGTGGRAILNKQATQLVAGDGQVYVDVLIAYTSAARAAYGGDMVALAQLAVDAANVAYANSNAGVVLRLAGTIQVDYTEVSFSQSLSDLANGVGVMTNVHAARDHVGADVVSLFVADIQYCGLGYLNSNVSSAFSAVSWSCAVSYYSFAHELGHNFGARHDPYVDPSTNPYAYGHGYVYNTSWRTIMSYVNACGSCPRLQYFSNPGVLYQSVPMGTADTNDNARVHRERAATVAAFKSATNPSYVLSLNDVPSAGGSVAGDGTYPAGSTVTASATPAAGYAFANWSDNGSVVSSSASYTFTLNSDRTLTAKFQATTTNYTISLGVKPGAGGIVDGAGSYPKGTIRTVTATANTGYTFANWTKGKKVMSDQPSYSFVLNSDIALTANFKRARTAKR